VAENTQLDAGTGGDVVRSHDRAGVKTQVVALDLNPAGAETLMAGAMPCAQSGTWSVVVSSLPAVTLSGTPAVTISGTVPVSGTFWQTTQPVSMADGALASLGAQADVAATTDTGTFSLLAFFKRLLSRVTTLLGQLPAALSGSGNLKVALAESTVTQTVSGTVTAVVGTVAAVTSITNVVHVDDNAGSLTVDGTVTANAGSGTFANQQSNVTADYDTGAGTQTLTLFGVALPASGGAVAGGTGTNPLRVDPTGTTAQPVSGTVTANQGGTWPVRLQDGLGNAITSTTSALDVNIKSGAGSGGTALADGATFTEGTTSLTPVGGVRDDTTTGTVAEDKAGVCRITTNRALHVNLRDVSGNELSVGGGTQYNEDDPSAGGEKVTLAGVIRQDTLASTTTTDGDFTNLKVTAAGRLYASATIDAALPAGANVIGGVTQSGTWNVGALTSITNVVHVDDNAGSLTVDGSITANQGGTWTVATNADASVGVGTAPSKSLVVAGQYNTAAPTPTNGQTVALQLDASGLLKVNVAAGGASGGTSSSFGSADPAAGTAAGFSDGTNLREARVFDLDSGAGAQYVLGVGLRKLASGGSVEAGTSSDPLRVDPTGTTTQPVSGTVSITANSSINLNQVAGASVATGHGTAAGAIRVELPTDGTGVVNAVQSGTWTVQPGNTANTTPWLTSLRPAASGGCTVFSGVSTGAANQDSFNIKASAGQLYGYALFNTTSSARYVKLYSKATAPLSTDTPLMRIYVPPQGGANLDSANGLVFGTGIGLRVTTGPGDSDTGAATTNDVLITFWYT
jgi:hypothetical protein